MRRELLGVLAVVIAAVAAFVPLPPEAVERWFSLGVYPPIQRTLTTTTNLLPFSFLDLLLVLLCAACAIAITRSSAAAIRTRRLAPIGRLILGLAAGAAAVYLVFLALWGLNYRRVRLPDRLELSQTPTASDAVVALGLQAVHHLNDLHAEAHRMGWRGAEWRSPTLTAAAASVQTRLSGAVPAVPGHLKGSMLGPYFRWTGVDGMVNPFGLEVIENPDLLPFERPFVAAHEWAHLAGFADESEANFVGFLTCMQAAVPEQYSGWLYLYWQIAGESDGRVRARLLGEMAAGPRADTEATISRLRRGEVPRLRVASWLVYDQYLKANKVEAGVRSYGAVVDLLVRARFEPGWVPVVRKQPRAGAHRR